MKLIATVAACMLAIPAGAQVFRCADASGRVVMQQSPCAGSGARVGDDIKKREDEARARRDEERRAAAAAAAATRTAEVEEKPDKLSPDLIQKDCGTRNIPETPVIGMTEATMLRCTLQGRVDALETYSTTDTARGQLKTMKFKDWAGRGFIYLSNGIVTRIHRY